jgi:hypothetical protein
MHVHGTNWLWVMPYQLAVTIKKKHYMTKMFIISEIHVGSETDARLTTVSNFISSSTYQRLPSSYKTMYDGARAIHPHNT